MAVFRIEKTKDYTVMSNHHLRNQSLTLKAKGLLSQMLSLPENWDYTLKGLSLINLEKVDAIRTAVLELEKNGYIVRNQTRDEKGRMSYVEFTILEEPYTKTPMNKELSPSLDFPITDNPITDNPTMDKPTTDNPTTDKPITENPMQLNIDISNTNKLNTDLLNTDSFLFNEKDKTETNGSETVKTELYNKQAFEIYRELIHENIDYDILIDTYPHDIDQINEIVDLMLEVLCSTQATMIIAKETYPIEIIKNKFMRLNSSHIEFVIDCLNNNTTKIRNIKKYVLATLFNSLTTINSYYTALVAHDEANR